MNWFWMNIPLGAAFFAAWAGIPLWLVLRQRSTGPGEHAWPGAAEEHLRDVIDQRVALRPMAGAGHEAEARGDAHARHPFCQAGMCALSELTTR